MMVRRLFFAAVLAGIAASLVMSVVQHFRVTPYILAAEVFEDRSHGHGLAPAEPGSEPQASEPQAWSPAEGLERTAYTALANLIVSIAFALALFGASFLLNLPITPANGALWGLCGFLAFSLAPSAGLPPELPGMPAGDLAARQIWWWFAVAATGAGLALIAKRRAAIHIVAAAILISLPHLIGAPEAPAQPTALPPHLASGFVANALATAAVFWVLLGLALGFLNERVAKEPLAHDTA